MKKIVSLLVAGLLLGAAVLPAAGEVVGQNNAAVKAVADPILDTILKGFDQGDYGLYSQYFDHTLKDLISKSKFLRVRKDILKKIGAYQSRSYLGYLRMGKATVVLWKGRFAGTPDDILIKLVLSRRGDRTEVLGLWFQ